MLSLLSADPSLGRFDISSLSDQTLMEMLVDGMQPDTKSQYHDDEGNFKDISAWENIECTEGRVTDITFYAHAHSDAQYPFEYIPRLVELFHVERSNIHGTLDTSVLPSGLTQFSVNSNRLQGEIAFKTFPQNLKHVDISVNLFEGSIMLGDLPPKLTFFDAIMNEFSGNISLDSLPETLEDVKLSANKLTGELHIKRLPSAMRNLFLNANSFSGEFRLVTAQPIPTALPALQVISIEGNPLSETVVLTRSNSRPSFKLISDTTKAVLDEVGERHPWEEQILWDNDPANQNSQTDEESYGSGDDGDDY